MLENLQVARTKHCPKSPSWWGGGSLTFPKKPVRLQASTLQASLCPFWHQPPPLEKSWAHHWDHYLYASNFTAGNITRNTSMLYCKLWKYGTCLSGLMCRDKLWSSLSGLHWLTKLNDSNISTHKLTTFFSYITLYVINVLAFMLLLTLLYVLFHDVHRLYCAVMLVLGLKGVLQRTFFISTNERLMYMFYKNCNYFIFK